MNLNYKGENNVFAGWALFKVFYKITTIVGIKQRMLLSKFDEFYRISSKQIVLRIKKLLRRKIHLKFQISR